MNLRAAEVLLRSAVLRAVGPVSRGWRDFSRLILVGDRSGWVVDEETRTLRSVCKSIGFRTVSDGWEAVSRRQCVFSPNRFILLDSRPEREHRMCIAYYHGKPGTGVPEFDAVFEQLRKKHPHYARIQVTHSEMRDVVLSSGIPAEKVFLIPIAIRLELFLMCTEENRARMRQRLGIPSEAFVAGSFQKDGSGWGEGLEPKWVKGPDVLVQVLRCLKERVPGLFILLSGPARGYVKRALSEAGIPFRHVFARHYEEIASLYHALDVYLVTSRQEGGPKSVLESMASGIPLVTTRVGQAMDLVRDGENGFMVPVGDVEGFVHAVQRVRGLESGARQVLLRKARAMAEANAWDRQHGLWKDFFAGVVE